MARIIRFFFTLLPILLLRGTKASFVSQNSSVLSSATIQTPHNHNSSKLRVSTIPIHQNSYYNIKSNHYHFPFTPTQFSLPPLSPFKFKNSPNKLRSGSPKSSETKSAFKRQIHQHVTHPSLDSDSNNSQNHNVPSSSYQRLFRFENMHSNSNNLKSSYQNNVRPDTQESHESLKFDDFPNLNLYHLKNNNSESHNEVLESILQEEIAPIALSRLIKTLWASNLANRREQIKSKQIEIHQDESKSKYELNTRDETSTTLKFTDVKLQNQSSSDPDLSKRHISIANDFERLKRDFKPQTKSHFKSRNESKPTSHFQVIQLIDSKYVSPIPSIVLTTPKEDNSTFNSSQPDFISLLSHFIYTERTKQNQFYKRKMQKIHGEVLDKVDIYDIPSILRSQSSANNNVTEKKIFPRAVSSDSISQELIESDVPQIISFLSKAVPAINRSFDPKVNNSSTLNTPSARQPKIHTSLPSLFNSSVANSIKHLNNITGQNDVSLVSFSRHNQLSTANSFSQSKIPKIPSNVQNQLDNEDEISSSSPSPPQSLPSIQKATINQIFTLDDISPKITQLLNSPSFFNIKSSTAVELPQDPSLLTNRDLQVDINPEISTVTNVKYTNLVNQQENPNFKFPEPIYTPWKPMLKPMVAFSVKGEQINLKTNDITTKSNENVSVKNGSQTIKPIAMFPAPGQIIKEFSMTSQKPSTIIEGPVFPSVFKLRKNGDSLFINEFKPQPELLSRFNYLSSDNFSSNLQTQVLPQQVPQSQNINLQPPSILSPNPPVLSQSQPQFPLKNKIPSQKSPQTQAQQFIIIVPESPISASRPPTISEAHLQSKRQFKSSQIFTETNLKPNQRIQSKPLVQSEPNLQPESHAISELQIKSDNDFKPITKLALESQFQSNSKFQPSSDFVSEPQVQSVTQLAVQKVQPDQIFQSQLKTQSFSNIKPETQSHSEGYVSLGKLPQSVSQVQLNKINSSLQNQQTTELQADDQLQTQHQFQSLSQFKNQQQSAPQFLTQTQIQSKPQILTQPQLQSRPIIQAQSPLQTGSQFLVQPQFQSGINSQTQPPKQSQFQAKPQSQLQNKPQLLVQQQLQPEPHFQSQSGHLAVKQPQAQSIPQMQTTQQQLQSVSFPRTQQQLQPESQFQAEPQVQSPPPLQPNSQVQNTLQIQSQSPLKSKPNQQYVPESQAQPQVQFISQLQPQPQLQSVSQAQSQLQLQSEIEPQIQKELQSGPHPQTQLQLSSGPQFQEQPQAQSNIPTQVLASTAQPERDYEFAWTVSEPEALLEYGHNEQRTGDTTNGQYQVLLPDGRTQIVKYVADDDGFKADVSYSNR